MGSPYEIYTITKSDKRYPELLKEIHNAPEILYIKGKLPETNWWLGMVGTRKPTEYGKIATEKFARELSATGAVIVSGLAYGIDAEVHKAVVQEKGIGVAVIGSGLDYDSFYPKANWQLGEEIIHCGGAVISEYASGTKARQWHFPERNRIIVGLIQGLIIIEAREKSGAQITARLALEENRDVFAIPGSIFSLSSVVPNRLIKDGAIPALSPIDVIEYYGKSALKNSSPHTEESPIMSAIIDALEEPLTLDELKLKTKLGMNELQAALSSLELSGKISEVEPGTYQIFT